MHRKRGRSARASPTPHHTLHEERTARFTAQPLSALILSFQVFFLSPLVSGNEIAIENRSENSQSSEVNENPSETDGPKTASFLQLMIPRRLLKGNKEHKMKNSSKLFQGECKLSNLVFCLFLFGCSDVKKINFTSNKLFLYYFRR